MSKYTSVNILDLLEQLGEEYIRTILSDFSCPKNDEIDFFLKNRAIDFANRKQSITYLVFDDENGNIAAYFTLTHKSIEISDESLSKTARRHLQRYAFLDETAKSYTTSAFLIAQFGKNMNENRITGNELMDNVFMLLTKIQREIGGGVVYLECEDNPKLLDFYQNEQNRFRYFSERYSETDRKKYIQLFRFI